MTNLSDAEIRELQRITQDLGYHQIHEIETLTPGINSEIYVLKFENNVKILAMYYIVPPSDPSFE